MARWEIDLLQNDGSLIATIEPEELSVEQELKVPDIVNFEISLGNPKVRRDFIIPYAADYRLRRINKVISGGIITQTNLKGEDDVIKVGGKGYLHYLEKRHYPYAGYPDFGTPYLTTTETEPVQIVRDLLEDTRDIDIYSLNYTVSNVGTTGHPMLYRIDPGDFEDLLSKITTLSDAYGAGFDFEMTPNKEFIMYCPEKFPSRDVRYVFTIDDLVDLEWTNVGPKGTHVVGVGAGSSTVLWINRSYPGNAAVFRRLDDVLNAGSDIRTIEALDSITSGQAGWGSNPQQECSIEIQPEVVEVGNFWDAILPGCYVQVFFDFYPFHRLESVRKVTKRSWSVTDTGEEIVTLDLQKFYDFSDDDGIDAP